jgi:hypothetical protein
MPPGTPGALRSAQALVQSLEGDTILTVSDAESFEPKYYVQIFNIGPIEHKVEKGTAGTFIIPACELGEPYSKPLRIPHPWVDTYIMEMERKTHIVSAEFMAQDIIRPTIGADWSFGQNRDDLGCFWTRNEVPSPEELMKARGMLENTFRKLLTEATTIETTGNFNEITPLMRIAATYFQEDRSWNRIYRKQAECPNCGGQVKDGIISHSCGYIFDLDRALVGGTLDIAKYQVLKRLRSGESIEEITEKPRSSGGGGRNSREP